MRIHCLLGFFFLPALSYGQVFKCTTPNGQVSFSNVPCSNAVGVSDRVNIQTNRLGTFAGAEDIERVHRETTASSDTMNVNGLLDPMDESPLEKRRRLRQDVKEKADSHADDDIYIPELNSREVPYSPDMDPTERRLKQIKNKLENPHPADASAKACREGRPARGAVKVGRAVIWPGMRSSEVRRLIGSPNTVNSILVGNEQWVYRQSDGGSLYVYIEGLCVSSIQ